MKTVEAYNEYLIYAQAQREYYNTLLWILFTFLVIAPICMAIIYICVELYIKRKS